MKSGRLSPYRVASLYVGTVVGAGFASGQEVLQFFGHHGLFGFWGLAIATALFVVFGAMTFVLGHRLRATSHLEVVQYGAGSWLGTIVDAMITFFLLGSFSAMAAGAGAVFHEQFGLPAVLGSLALCALSVLTVLMGIQGVVSAISFVAPFLIGSVFLISAVSIAQNPIDWNWYQPQSASVPFWPVAAIIYGSYNMVFAIPILAPAGTLSDEHSLKKGALFGGIGLGFAALTIQLGMLSAMSEASQYDVPMLLLASQVFGAFAPIYSIVLLAEVYTTAIGSLYGFVARVTARNKPLFSVVTLGTGLVGFIGSLIGFSNIVGKVYAAIGYAGIILLLSLAAAYVRCSRRPNF